MDREIDESDAEHVMVCLHHPPVVMDSRWLDSVGLENRYEFLARVAASGKVRLVIFGHVHQAYDADHNGIRILGTPSTCRQFAPKRASFAVDDQPPAYRRIQLHEDGNIEHELVWLMK
jgi:Icc protein